MAGLHSADCLQFAWFEFTHTQTETNRQTKFLKFDHSCSGMYINRLFMLLSKRGRGRERVLADPLCNSHSCRTLRTTPTSIWKVIQLVGEWVSHEMNEKRGGTSVSFSQFILQAVCLVCASLAEDSCSRSSASSPLFASLYICCSSSPFSRLIRLPLMCTSGGGSLVVEVV